MNRILTLRSSILGSDSASNQLIDGFLAALEAPSADLEVVNRDVGTEAVPAFGPEWIAALSTPEAQRDDRQRERVALSDTLIAELQSTDLLVLGAPMYNFSIGSGLKAWIDHVARAGVTFRYTEDGPQGLLTGKRVVVVATMGGWHEPGETDHLRPYLKTVLGFLGLHRVQIVTAAGLNLGDESRHAGLGRARQALAAIAADIRQSHAGRGDSREAA